MARRLRSEAKVRVPVALNAEGTGLLSVSRTPPVDRPGAVRPRRDDDDDDGSEEDEGEQKDNRGGIRDGQEEEDAGGNDLNGSSQENEEDDFNVRKATNRAIDDEDASQEKPQLQIHIEDTTGAAKGGSGSESPAYSPRSGPPASTAPTGDEDEAGILSLSGLRNQVLANARTWFRPASNQTLEVITVKHISKQRKTYWEAVLTLQRYDDDGMLLDEFSKMRSNRREGKTRSAAVTNLLEKLENGLQPWSAWTGRER